MLKRILLAAIAIILVIAAGYASFFVAPTERTMGVIQRIFYFHVGSAWAGMDAFFVCFIANLLYDVFADRLRQYGTLIALGFSPARGTAPGLVLALTIALSGTIAGFVVAVVFTPRRCSSASGLSVNFPIGTADSGR